LCSFSVQILYSKPSFVLRFLLKKSTVILMGLPLYVIFYSLTLIAFNIFALFSMQIFLYIIQWKGCILVMSTWCSRGFIYLDGQIFLEICGVFCYYFCWIYFLCLFLLWCLRFAGFVFWWSCRVLQILFITLQSVL
jgi:hypothetical protein